MEVEAEIVDPHFSRAFPLDGKTRFFVVEQPFKKTVWSRHLFLFYFKRENKIRKKKNINVTPDKKRQVWENKV